MENYHKNMCSKVAALDIDAPELKKILWKIAQAMDDDYAIVSPQDIAIEFRVASTALGKHVHEHSAKSLSERGIAHATNTEFEQFETLAEDQDRSSLRKYRDTFSTVGTLAAHGKTGVITKKGVANALDAILIYIELWITKFAPVGERKQIAYKDPYLDKVADYRKRAQRRLTELMGDIPDNCYLERKVRFRRPLDRDEQKSDEDPFGWEADRDEYNTRDFPLPGESNTFAPLETHPRSLLLGQAGMGKSLEAAQLAVRLTCADGNKPLACCIVLECRDIDITPTTGTLAPPSVETETFRMFCDLEGWKRYLILDGFDEIKVKGKTREAFHQAVTKFQEQYPGVHLLITSRDVTAVSATFFSSWKAYELLELDETSVVNYLAIIWEMNRALIVEVADQWDRLDKHDNIRRLLMRPFFLSAFAETLKSGDEIQGMGRHWLVKRFIEELLIRQRRKGGQELTDTERHLLLSMLENHAFRVVTGQAAAEPAKVDYLAGLDLLLRSGDKQFKQAEFRDYLAASYLFGKPSEETFHFLGTLEDEQRFTVHGWLMEFVNGEPLNTKNKSWVLNRLWQDDPLLVALGLHSESQLRLLVLPTRPWEPYEIGLLKIMRGIEQVAEISETREIRDIRLSSPGEKLLHRLSQPDLPYLIRAVPDRRAVARLEAAWNGAADPWSEIMRPLSPIAREWLETRPAPLVRSLGFIYGVLEPPATVEQSIKFFEAIDKDEVETEALVRLMLALKKLRGQSGTEKNKTKAVDTAIWQLWPKVLDRPLSAKQFHRLLVHETQGMKSVSDISQDPVLGPKIQRLMYQGEVDDFARLESVRMKPLIVEFRRLSCFGDRTSAQQFAAQLWSQVVALDDVTAIPPVTLAQGLFVRLITVETQGSKEWLSQWLTYWLERLNCYEAIVLQTRGVQFAITPPSFVDAQGWHQARDAVKLANMQDKATQPLALPAYEYTHEQKRHWLATATISELVRLLQFEVISRSADDDVFKQSVRRLEEDSHPQHWWVLVRNGLLNLGDISNTANELVDEAKSNPVAYELLECVDWYKEPPSEKVIDLTARCVDCPLDTRAYLVNHGKVSVEACWEAETNYLNEVRRKIAAGEPMHGIGDDDDPRPRGGLARGFYTLIFGRGMATSNDIYFSHPAFDTPINFRNDLSIDTILRESRQWRDGDLVMGFLWVNPAASLLEHTITVTQHRRRFARTDYVIRDGEPLWSPWWAT